jgi:hypothetical protein
VTAPSVEVATDLVGAAVDVMRAFQQSRSRWQTTTFGLAGQVTTASMHYLAFGDSVGVGWRDFGHPLGWTFGAAQREEFEDSPGFTFAAAAVGKPDQSIGERKALLGIELTSRALLEHRPGAQLLYAMIAAETLLLSRRRGSQTWQLARRAMFLVGHSDGVHCGRDTQTCPFLALSPDSKPDLVDIKRVRDLARTDVRWRCSEWLRILDWYDIRSDIVHEGASESEEESSKVVFWLATRVVPASLEWFAAHPINPLERLDRAIAELPEAPDWQRIIEGATEPDRE